jgi:Dullard-like phosphatase family protein
MDASIPSEEIKVPSFKFLKAKSATIRNPLLSNKGSVRIIKSEKELKSYLLAPPSTSTKLSTFIDDGKTSNRRYSQSNNIQDMPLLSSINDDTSSTLSEMTSSERLPDIFQLPMFEVHNTMHSLRFNSNTAKLNKEVAKDKVKKEKVIEMDETIRPNIENMTTILSPSQHKYFTIMNSFKTNYLNHVLNDNRVYFQYVSMSRQNLNFVSSEKFTEEYKLNLTQKEKFFRNLCKYHGKKTLVLDLDETLILAMKRKPVVYDTVLSYNGCDVIYLKLRPFLKEFLEDMQKLYELIIYTSAEQAYANAALDFIEQEQRYFSHRLYQTQCLRRGDKYLFKNLELLCSNRNMNDIIIVDNLVRNYSLSVRNGIPISDYKGDDNDHQLVHLAIYLRKLATETSIPEAINRDFAAFLLKRYEST